VRVNFAIKVICCGYGRSGQESDFSLCSGEYYYCPRDSHATGQATDQAAAEMHSWAVYVLRATAARPPLAEWLARAHASDQEARDHQAGRQQSSSMTSSSATTASCRAGGHPGGHHVSELDNEGSGALGEIRTPDPQIRSLMLYPAELRALTALRPASNIQACCRFGRASPRADARFSSML
jgi:hypothetical protein